MRRYLLSLLLISISLSSFSQLIPLNDEYLANPNLTNPATSGLNKGTDFVVSFRNQWSGYAGAPKFQSFGVDTRIKAMGRYNHTGEVIRKSKIPRTGRVGLSISATNDYNAPFTRTGMQMAYAYHKPISNGDYGLLSIGASLLLYQQKLDLSNLGDYKVSDPALMNYQNLFLPNLGLGVHYQYQNWSLGLAGINVIPLSIDHSGSSYGEKVKNQIYLDLNYSARLSEKVVYTPGVHVTNTPGGISLLNRFQFGKHIHLTGIWRTTDAVVILTELSFLSYRIGYAFDFSYGDIMSYNEGSHFLFLAYSF